MSGRWSDIFRQRRAPPAETKANRPGAFVALSSAGRPVWSSTDYAALARMGYMRNPFVHRAVRMLAEGVGQVPWFLKDGVRDIEHHPFLELMRRPDGHGGAAAFVEQVAGHLLVAGNAYVEASLIDGRPVALHVLRPDRMRVVSGADGWPAAYDYTVDGRVTRIPAAAGIGPAPVLHIRTFHPLDDHYGLAPIEAALTSLDIHNAAAAWNKALLDNAARPSGALVYTGANGLTDDQFERLKKELESGYQGTDNAGRPLVLEGGLDWKAMALSPKDMDFVEARNMAAREIALAFGVPPMLLGIPGDATYANYQEANRALWRQTILPLARRIADAVGGWLLPAWGDGLAVDLDLDQIPALLSERDGLWERVGKASFLSEEEKRAAVGYGPSDKARADRPASAAGAEEERWT
ncbi:phage portal protein [Pleomorphomonas koreensis]|uniref:phage portal protein n=1 Tax=Pleomorphomonas koreensis TaxID=257440 RepID=UPI00041F5A6F|nr:phage portal protein [Pleomorphomonas koreensis]